MLKYFTASVMLLFLVACDGNAPATEALAPEPWAASPHEQWPQLVLTNKAAFNGSTPLRGASGFLIRSESGEILAATAKHLIGENGGVEPEITLTTLDTAFKSWIMHPRTKPQQVVKIIGSASTTSSPNYNDWLLLKTEGPTTAATPLRIRKTPVKVGDRVHLVGVSYAEPDAAQKVYSGVVTARGFGDRFRYSVEPHVNIMGFSGAPIVDDDGLLVGVMTVWFKPTMDGEMWTEAGGEDAVSALKILKKAP